MSPRSAVTALLKVREIRERQAQAEVAAAHQEWVRATSAANRRERELAGVSLPKGMSLSSFLAISASKQAMAADVVRLRQIIAERDADRSAAVSRWGAAERDRSGAAELVKREKEAAEAEALRTEQRELDEIGARRALRARQGRA